MSLSMAATSLNNLLQLGDQEANLDGLAFAETLRVRSVDLQMLHHFFSATSYTVGAPVAQEVVRSDIIKIVMSVRDDILTY
jgi:hypothetical protein